MDRLAVPRIVGGNREYSCCRRFGRRRPRHHRLQPPPEAESLTLTEAIPAFFRDFDQDSAALPNLVVQLEAGLDEEGIDIDAEDHKTRALTLDPLTDAFLGGANAPDGVEAADQTPVVVFGRSTFDFDTNKETALEPNQVCIESDSTVQYTRTYTDGEACFRDGSCDVTRSDVEIRKELSFIAAGWFDLFKTRGPEGTEKRDDRAAAELHVEASRERMQHRALQDRHADDPGHRCDIDRRGGEGVAGDQSLGLRADILALADARGRQASADDRGRDALDRRQQSVQAEIRGRKPVGRACEVDRHEYDRCRSGYGVEESLLMQQHAAEVGHDAGQFAIGGSPSEWIRRRMGGRKRVEAVEPALRDDDGPIGMRARISRSGASTACCAGSPTRMTAMTRLARASHAARSSAGA